MAQPDSNSENNVCWNKISNPYYIALEYSCVNVSIPWISNRRRCNACSHCAIAKSEMPEQTTYLGSKVTTQSCQSFYHHCTHIKAYVSTNIHIKTRLIVISLTVIAYERKTPCCRSYHPKDMGWGTNTALSTSTSWNLYIITSGV